jgi:hypothetical protein
MIARSMSMAPAWMMRGSLRPLKRLFITLLLACCTLFAEGFHGDAQAQNIDPGWLTVKQWQVKMHLTQILDKQNLLLQGSTCKYDYTLALDHISDVTGEFSATGSEGLWQGSLASQETVNDTLDLLATGDTFCPLGDVYFVETCAGPGSEDNVAFSINPATGKYVISFPQTGIDCPVQYIAIQGSITETVLAEIDGDFIIDYPGMVLAESSSEPVTTLEFSLPSGPPQTITGETTFQHSSYPEVPITWSWELVPVAGEPESELGCPDGKCKGSGGASAPGSGYGVPVWTVNMANLNVFITDTPLWHRSPIGPPLEVTLSYNSDRKSVV